MRARIAALLVSLVILAAPLPACAEDVSLEETPAIELDCASALLMEAESGQVIFTKNADEKRPVASIVKEMTILLALEALESGRVKAEDVVTVSKNASGMGGSQVLLDTGEQLDFGTLLLCTIVASANDAAVAIAEHMYGSVGLCVARMNERALELGMEDTHYVNCTGLPAEGQYTTARDIAKLSREVFRHERYFEMSGVWLDELRHPDGRVTQLTNTNRLIRLYAGCDGGKTGSTDEAGYCISATAARADMRLIAVVLGSDTGKIRFSVASDMFDHGFANYKLYPVAESGAAVKGALPVEGGDKEDIKLRLEGDLMLLLPKGAEADVQLQPELPETLSAPVNEGDIVGDVNVLLHGRAVGSVPVAAAESVARTGIANGFRRVLRVWLYR